MTNANRLQYIKNFSKLYDRMQLIKSDYIPNDYKSMLFQYLEQRECAYLSEYNLTVEDVDENLEIFESCLRDTMNSIKWSYSICQIAVGLMKKFSMDSNLIYVLENYKFERHFDKYFKNIESKRPILPDDHFLTIPLAIIMDIFQHIISNNIDENSAKEAQRKLELEKLNEKFKIMFSRTTLRQISEAKKTNTVKAQIHTSNLHSIIESHSDDDTSEDEEVGGNENICGLNSIIEPEKKEEELNLCIDTNIDNEEEEHEDLSLTINEKDTLDESDDSGVTTLTTTTTIDTDNDDDDDSSDSSIIELKVGKKLEDNISNTVLNYSHLRNFIV